MAAPAAALIAVGLALVAFAALATLATPAATPPLPSQQEGATTAATVMTPDPQPAPSPRKDWSR